jgi:hypothetical protein
MRRLLIAVALGVVSLSLTACLGNDGCEGTTLTPVEESASELATSCGESIVLDRLGYAVTCDRVRGSLVGEEVARGPGYIARSIVVISTTTALAVGDLDDLGIHRKGVTCDGWRYAPSEAISHQYWEEIHRRVTVPTGRSES